LQPRVNLFLRDFMQKDVSRKGSLSAYLSAAALLPPTKNGKKTSPPAISHRVSHSEKALGVAASGRLLGNQHQRDPPPRQSRGTVYLGQVLQRLRDRSQQIETLILVEHLAAFEEQTELDLVAFL